MELYAAIDLHSNNSILVVLDKDDHVILERRFKNDLERIRLALAPHREAICGQDFEFIEAPLNCV